MDAYIQLYISHSHIYILVYEFFNAGGDVIQFFIVFFELLYNYGACSYDLLLLSPHFNSQLSIITHIMNHRKKAVNLLTVILVIGWVISTTYFFWSFQFKYITSFIPMDKIGNAGYFNETEFVKSTESYYSELYDSNLNDSEVLVINYRAAECPCTRYSETHLNTIKNRYKNSKVRFVTFTEKQGEPSLQPPAYPAIAVINSKGKLAYFGPYSNQMLCGEGEGFIDIALQNVLSGSGISNMNLLASGCFCKSNHKS